MFVIYTFISSTLIKFTREYYLATTYKLTTARPLSSSAIHRLPRAIPIDSPDSMSSLLERYPQDCLDSTSSLLERYQPTALEARALEFIYPESGRAPGRAPGRVPGSRPRVAPRAATRVATRVAIRKARGARTGISPPPNFRYISVSL